MSHNRDKIKATLQYAEAYANGQEVEFRSSCSEKWGPVNYWNFESFSTSTELRIKPTPKLRAWKPDEVPVGALIRGNAYKFKSMILGCSPDGGIWYADSEKTHVQDSEYMLRHYDHSTDGGKSWHPCGVAE